MQTEPHLISKRVDFENDTDGALVVKHSQFIPDEFITQNRLERADSVSTPAGEFHRVARIPEAFADKWGMEYLMNASVADILKRLRQEQLDGFITSNKVF